MARLFGIVLLLCVSTPVFAQLNAVQRDERYKVVVNPVRYPQSTPEETMQSVGKALNDQDLVYLMAWLTDPDYVDSRVKPLMDKYQGGTEDERALVAFEELVNQIALHFERQPSLIQELRQFVTEGKWNMELKAIEVPDIQSRRVFLKEVKGRWVLENRQQ